MMPFKPLFLVVALAAFASSSHAQTAGTCVTGTAQAVLTTPHIKASLFNTGGLFFGGTTTRGDGYLIPRTDNLSTIFAASLWLGGKVDGDLRVAAARYGGYDFWPGPLEDAARPPADCSAYDRIYAVSRADIQRYYETGELAEDLRDWPHQLGAPVRDGDGDPTNYDLRAGDQPDLIGDMAAWWVMHDAGNDHNPGAPLGVEVRVQAFTYGSEGVALPPALAVSTFYRYEILNLGHQPIEDLYLSLFADVDLGDAADDYIGTDTLRHMGFVYNATNEDAQYGTAPPAQGIQILQGPVGLANGRDDDRDGEVDEPEERLGLTSTVRIFPPGLHHVPGNPEEFRFYMLGLWSNGTPIYEWGNGFEQPGNPITRFMYPGDPVTESLWSERNTDANGTDSPLGDRRMMVSTGPFRLEPGTSETVLLALPYARGTDNLQSITELRQVARTLQVASSSGVFERSPTVRPDEIRVPGTVSPPLTLSRVLPNPARGAATVRLTLPAEARTHAVVLDALGRELATVTDGVLPVGETVLTLPQELAPGRYLLRVRVEPGGEETLLFTVAR
ncbi:MAG: hypothetical protein Rubg2KO_23570 [Rubricoccaceae bacterium]